MWQVVVIIPPEPIYTQEGDVLLLQPISSTHTHKHPTQAMVISSLVCDSWSLMLNLID